MDLIRFLLWIKPDHVAPNIALPASREWLRPRAEGDPWKPELGSQRWWGSCLQGAGQGGNGNPGSSQRRVRKCLTSGRSQRPPGQVCCPGSLLGAPGVLAPSVPALPGAHAMPPLEAVLCLPPQAGFPPRAPRAPIIHLQPAEHPSADTGCSLLAHSHPAWIWGSCAAAMMSWPSESSVH